MKMEEPELIKMLKYILLGSFLLLPVNCGPLITERPPVVPVPIHDSGEEYSDVIPSLISNPNGGSSQPKPSSTNPLSMLMSMSMSDDGAGGRVMMSPVPHISEIEDFAPNSTGGQKHVRQVHDTSSGPGSPPPSDELCSIFQFFLEPRRYSRCRVSNSYSDNEHSDSVPSPPLREMIGPEPPFEFSPNYHGPGSNEVIPTSGPNSDNFQSGSETREVESADHRQLPHQFSPGMNIDQGRRENGEPSASKRYDHHIEEIPIHHGHLPGPDHDHLVPPPPGPPPMFPKSSLDRTTIIVPERPCPRGERRDHKGFCRRIVRVRPSYQYGPPPPPPHYGHSRPIRYYYSRFVSVPTLQFFIPAVP